MPNHSVVWPRLTSAIDELYETTGSMKPHAAKVLMKGLWPARLARPDISYSVGRLASRISVWTRAEDVHLHRVVSYVHWTKKYSMVFQAGSVENTEIHVYADADLASCVHSARSTSGMMIILAIRIFTLADCMELVMPVIASKIDN